MRCSEPEIDIQQVACHKFKDVGAIFCALNADSGRCADELHRSTPEQTDGGPIHRVTVA